MTGRIHKDEICYKTFILVLKLQDYSKAYQQYLSKKFTFSDFHKNNWKILYFGFLNTMLYITLLIWLTQNYHFRFSQPNLGFFDSLFVFKLLKQNLFECSPEVIVEDSVDDLEIFL